MVFPVVDSFDLSRILDWDARILRSIVLRVVNSESFERIASVSLFMKCNNLTVSDVFFKDRGNNWPNSSSAHIVVHCDDKDDDDWCGYDENADDEW